MKETAKPRGGARKGAGRKPSPVPHKRINIYLTRAEVYQLKQIDPSPSHAVRKLLKEQTK